jgi:hypothetical protein
MTYRGQMKNGVVVLDGNPQLTDGTEVRVETLDAAPKPRIGSAEAIMQAVESGAVWQGDPAEVDRFLADRKKEKQAEVQAQMAEWKREQLEEPTDTR